MCRVCGREMGYVHCTPDTVLQRTERLFITKAVLSHRSNEAFDPGGV